jgi:hypothetical protein
LCETIFFCTVDDHFFMIMYPPTPTIMRTQVATVATAMGLAGTTPLSAGGGAELIPIGAAAATTAREGVGLGLVDRVLVAVVVVEVSVPVPVAAEVLEGGVGVGASPDPEGGPVAELDCTTDTVRVSV